MMDDKGFFTASTRFREPGLGRASEINSTVFGRLEAFEMLADAVKSAAALAPNDVEISVTQDTAEGSFVIFEASGTAQEVKAKLDAQRPPIAHARDRASAYRDTIEQLTSQTGLSRDELLSRFKSVLPMAVDKLTPQGRLPTEAETAQWKV